MEIPINEQEACSYEEWLKDEGVCIDIEAPKGTPMQCEKSYGTRSLITEIFPCYRSIPKQLPEIPDGSVIKEWFRSPTVMVSMYVRPEHFQAWWDVCGSDHEFILKATANRGETVIGEIVGVRSEAIESEARLAEISAGSM